MTRTKPRISEKESDLLKAAKFALKFINDHETNTGKRLPYSFYATQSLEAAIRNYEA